MVRGWREGWEQRMHRLMMVIVGVVQPNGEGREGGLGSASGLMMVIGTEQRMVRQDGGRSRYAIIRMVGGLLIPRSQHSGLGVRLYKICSFPLFRFSC